MAELRKKGSIHNYKPTHDRPNVGLRPMLTCIKCNSRALNEHMEQWRGFKVCKGGCR